MKRLIDNLTYRWSCDPRGMLRAGALAFALCALGLSLQSPSGPIGEVQHAWVQIGLIILSVGLSILAGQLLNKKNDSPVRSDKPTTLATRGSFTSWHVGIRRTGLVFCWAGDREIRQEKVEGAGGKDLFGSDPEQDVFYEGGMHVAGVGPMFALHEIVQAGKTIFTGPITRESHPSGTTVSLGKEGSFVIYWGEVDQPINTFLGNSNRIGVSSRWPFFCYIQWNKKRLGPSPNWPVLDYVFERRPHEESGSVLAGSSSWYNPQFTLDGPIHNIQSANSNADETVGYLELLGALTHIYTPTTQVELTGTGMTNGTYEVLKSEIVQTQVGSTLGNYPIYRADTRVFLQGGTLGATGGGTIQSYSEDTSDGANLAHTIEELLFAPHPQGCALPPGGFEPWDIDSLDALGAEAEADGWRTSILATEGETCEALLANMLQDHGTLLPLDTNTGNMLFQRVRFPVGTIPNLIDDVWADELPEIETVHDERPADKLVFTFTDRDNLFGDMTIAIDDDGQASLNNNQRARKVGILSTVHYPTAAALAELRSPEELANGAGEFRLDSGREARELLPGQAIIADQFQEVLRVVSVGIDPLSERVQVKVIPDFYGAPKTAFENLPGKPPPIAQAPEPDLAVAWAELPEQVLGSLGSAQTIVVPHIRAHGEIAFTAIHLSPDDMTYTLWGTSSFVQTGGTLQTALSATGPTFLAQGPVYDELGPDNATLTQDLSADLTNWGLGRQLAVIASSVGTEICFLQKATVVVAGQRRLDGLLRARYDTRKLAHPAGAKVFIFDRDAITPVQDVLLAPAADLYVKSQPGTSSGQVLLSAVSPIGEELQGKGQVPITPDYVHVRAPFRSSPAFQTGDNVTIGWAISSGTPGTGCGGQPAGFAIGPAVVPGTAQIELLTTGDVVQLVTSAPAGDAQYVITNAALVAAFGSEPSAFKVRVSHVANGYVSDTSPSLTITRVA